MQAEEQEAALQKLIADASSPDEVKNIVNQILDASSTIPLFIARPCLSAVIIKAATSEDLLQFIGQALESRTSTFEEQTCLLKETRATYLESQNEFLEAARTLESISLDSGQRVISDDYKLKIYIRIMRCFLEEDETTSAETYLTRATSLIRPETDVETTLHFKLSQARVFDAKRKFMEASRRYNELSFSLAILESERSACLDAAITCAVLAPAGPARSRLLAALYKDDRSPSLQNYKILEKMFLDRLISSIEMSEFEKTLKPHQLAKLADGTTVLSRAVIEHNLLAVSLIYDNIELASLSQILGLDERAAESFARGMIESQRLQGEIDQVSGIIDFTTDQENLEIKRWDESIAALLGEVEAVAAQIEKRHPEWLETRKVAI